MFLSYFDNFFQYSSFHTLKWANWYCHGLSSGIVILESQLVICTKSVFKNPYCISDPGNSEHSPPCLSTDCSYETWTARTERLSEESEK